MSKKLVMEMLGSVRAINQKDFVDYGVSEEAIASRANTLIPSSFDLEKNIDVLPVVFNLAVVNQFNDNDDAMSTEVASEVVKQFINKPLNIEHNKTQIVGHIINASFSDKQPEFKENDINEFKGRDDAFYITAAAVIYRHIYPDLADVIAKASDEDNELYQVFSTSWEIGFKNWNIGLGNGEFKDVNVIKKGTADYEILKSNLKRYGGSGNSAKGRVRRIVQSPVYPLGAGITINPAASVKGISVLQGMFDEEKNTEEKEKEISQETNSHVNANKSSQLKMTEEQFKALLEAIEQSNASADIANQLKTAFDSQVNWQSKTEEAQAALAKTKEELENIKADFASTSNELKELKIQAEAKASADLFNNRVKVITGKFDLTEDQEKVVVEDLKNLDSADASFEAYEAKASILFLSKEDKETAEAARKAEVAKAAEELLEAQASKGDSKEDELETENAEAKVTNNNADSTAKKTLLERIAENGLQTTVS